MKKIIIALILISLSAPMFADDLIPQWSEFCPDKYLNVQWEKNTWEKWKIFPSFIPLIGIIYLPYALYRDHQGKEINKKDYWYDRKLAFQKEVNSCGMLENNDNRINCYIKVRDMEQHKNDINNGAYRPQVYVRNNIYRN